MKYLALLLMSTIALLTSCSNKPNMGPLKLRYIQAYEGATVSCQHKAIADRHWVYCNLSDRPHSGLWTMEGEDFFAVNGPAISTAEKVGLEQHPDAATFDIESLLAEFGG